MSQPALPPAIDSPPPAAPRWLAATEVLLIFCVFFIQGAAAVPEVNEPHYLGKAKNYWNPTWAANDFFLASPDAHVVFYWSIGWLTKFFSLPATAWIGRLLGWGLLAWSWRRASWALAPKPLLAVLSAAIFAATVARYHLAGEWVIGGVEAKVFAYALVLLAVEALIAGRWNRVWLLLGGASALHVLVGGWSVLAAGFAWLRDDPQTRPPLKQMTWSLVGGFLLSLPGLLPAVLLTRGVDPRIVSEANQIYVFIRLPHHLALHTLDGAEMFTRLVRNGPLLLVFMALVYLVTSNPGVRRLRAFVVGAMLLVVLGFGIGFATEHDPALAAKLLRYYWFRLYDFALPLGVALLACLLLAQWQARRPRVAAVLLVALLGFSGWHLASVVQARQENPYPPADRGARNSADWQDVCAWIAANTPPDAVFMTERMSSSFKWYTGRAEVVTQKDIPQDAENIVKWWRRMDAVHRYRDGEERHYRKSLAHQGAPMLARLADKYSVDYLVTLTARPLPFPVLYQNATFTVYQMPSASRDLLEAPRRQE